MTKPVYDPEICSFDPRTLPDHLVCGAAFLAAGAPNPPTLTAFLARFDSEFPDPRDLWLIEVWNRGSGGMTVATAVFTSVDQMVECPAMWIDPSCTVDGMALYLKNLGSSLWGGLPFADNVCP